MRTVLLVTADNGLRARLVRSLGDASVFVAQNDSDALRTLRLIDVDAIFRDCTGSGHALGVFVSRVKELTPGAQVVAIGPAGADLEVADFTLSGSFSAEDLEKLLQQIADRQTLLSEIAALRAQAMPAVVSPPTPESQLDASAFPRVLKEFTRVLAAGFDLPRVLDMFLDAIGELLRPSRSAILLLDDNRQLYCVRAHRGLAPQIVESVRLSATNGLSRWLARQGRPARLQELSDPVVARELTLLGGVVAVPLLTHGDLVGMLVVGQRVIGGTYGRYETEMLFDLGTHLATAIRDITLHHQLHREKQFSERILIHMSSGVITIGRDERIGTMNRRAEEILGLSAAETLRRDLRALPSPLGDMLFETLVHGRPLPRSEIQLALRDLWLEVTTYPIFGDESAALGAVLVFEDRTAQKELAARKRQAEEFQLLARVIARIADEIKNPLVSINTFVELIDERYDDPDFRKLFSAVVGRDVRRLVQVFEKLAGLVSEGELNFSTVDVHTVIDEVAAAIDGSDEALGKRLHLEIMRDAQPRPVRVDPPQFRRALSYLIWYLAHNSPAEEAKVSISIGTHSDRENGDSVRVLIGSRTASVDGSKLGRLFDPVHMVQESLIDVGPAVSQRLIEAQGAHLQCRQTRNELAFVVTLAAVRS